MFQQYKNLVLCRFLWAVFPTIVFNLILQPLSKKLRLYKHQRLTEKGGELDNGAQCEIMLNTEPFG